MDENKKLVIAALFVMLGGNTGSILNSINPDVRADAFTMTDWLEGRAWLVEHIDVHFAEELARHVDNEKSIQRLQYRMGQCERMTIQ